MGIPDSVARNARRGMGRTRKDDELTTGHHREGESGAAASWRKIANSSAAWIRSSDRGRWAVDQVRYMPAPGLQHLWASLLPLPGSLPRGPPLVPGALRHDTTCHLVLTTLHCLCLCRSLHADLRLIISPRARRAGGAAARLHCLLYHTRGLLYCTAGYLRYAFCAPRILHLLSAFFLPR